MFDAQILQRAIKELYQNQQKLVDSERPTLQLVNLNGLLIHTLFFFLFIYIDIPWLALVNVFSIAAWLISIFLTSQGYTSQSTILIAIEIVAHAALATHEMGLAAGFQIYLWPAVLLMCILPARHTKAPFLCLVIISLPLILLNMLAPYEKEQYQDVYSWLYAFNLISATLPFILIAALIRALFTHNFLSMEHYANNDELTKLINRRRAYELLKEAQDNQSKITLALGDIDYFKSINDNLGHSAGDDVLKSIARYFTDTTKNHGICCRWGGEEFLFIFQNHTLSDVHQRMSHLCQTLPEQVYLADLDHPITCSFGVIEIASNESLDRALSRVDQLLYQAKENGRYQVACEGQSKDKTRD